MKLWSCLHSHVYICIPKLLFWDLGVLLLYYFFSYSNIQVLSTEGTVADSTVDTYISISTSVVSVEETNENFLVEGTGAIVEETFEETSIDISTSTAKKGDK